MRLGNSIEEEALGWSGRYCKANKRPMGDLSEIGILLWHSLGLKKIVLQAIMKEKMNELSIGSNRHQRGKELKKICVGFHTAFGGRVAIGYNFFERPIRD